MFLSSKTLAQVIKHFVGRKERRKGRKERRWRKKRMKEEGAGGRKEKEEGREEGIPGKVSDCLSEFLPGNPEWWHSDLKLT